MVRSRTESERSETCRGASPNGRGMSKARHRLAAWAGAVLAFTIFVMPLIMAGVAEAAPLAPTGTWLIADGRARIRIEKCGPAEKEICGFVVWLKIPLDDHGKPRVDVKNPDPKRRARAILGQQIILGLKLNEDDRYEGKVYNSDEGKLADVSIWSEDPGEMKIHGCMLAIICGSQTWTEVKDVIAGQLTGPTNGPGGPRTDPEWTPKAEPVKATPSQN